MVLGKIVEGNKLYGHGADDTMCIPVEGAVLKDQLAKAIKNIRFKAAAVAETSEDIFDDDNIEIPLNVRNFSYAVIADKLYYRNNSDFEKFEGKKSDIPRIKGMIEIRDCLREVISCQIDKPADDSDLFTFAADENWKDKLSSNKMKKLSALITDYERCLSRIRACGQPVKDRQRRNDIQRILYSRGQDREYDADMLYTLFQGTPPERITAIRQELQAKNWHLKPKEQRDDFLADLIPELERYYPLFSDFRFGGYRVLIDLIADIDDENNLTDR
ncbi:hypothetical protein [Ruminococcus flavefaciens]|uniref:hypothetical protein n=1 Tax=Ruminococcus flavefaciens TaxID=1265 RepID=UPI003F017F13